MHKYRLISKKGEGTFSEVLQAQSIKTNKQVAIKCMKANFYNIEKVNDLREIQALKRLSPHPNIITLLEVLYDEPTGRLALVFELMEMNMYEAIKGKRSPLPEQRVKNMMYQVLKAIDHMHRNGIYHRDIKPENILITGDVVKLADFGSCRGIYSKPPFTEYISTRWYRPPECLLTDGYYNHKMDYWGVGCVFFEVLTLTPLFPGTNELDQVHKIHNILGTPQKELLDQFQKVASHMEFDFPEKQGTGLTKLIPQYSDACDIITKLLIYNHNHRLSATQALKHPYFQDLREQDRILQEQNLQSGINSAAPTPSQMSKVFRMTQRAHESMSVNSKSMSKISDNVSDGSFNNQYSNDITGGSVGVSGAHGIYSKKKKKNHYINMKKGPLATQHSGGQFADLKIDNSKHQTFNSDFEDNVASSVVGGVSTIGKNHHNSSFMQNQSLLPPIFQPSKKVKKKHSGGALGINNSNMSNGAPHIGQPYFPGQGAHGGHSPIMNITMNQVTVNHFNTTKKNFPTIKKITDNQKKYVSPYSIKSMNKQ